MLPSQAQTNEWLAFLNGSGQLVVVSGDGLARWIVTNPGQILDDALGFAWADDGNLVFALEDFGAFWGNPDTQTITPIAPADTDKIAVLRGIPTRPNLTQSSAQSADGLYTFLWRDGQYATMPTGTTITHPLRLVGNNPTQSSGLWSDVAPLVAYWGMNNGSNETALAVWNPVTQADVVLDSGSTIPIPPIAWLPNSTDLVFRNPAGEVQMADMACMMSSCDQNPLTTGVMLAPSSASQIQVTATHAYYVDEQVIYGVDFACLNANNCIDTRFVIGDRAVPLTMLHVRGEHLVFTSYERDANNINDRTVQWVDVSCAPTCEPQALLNGAIAGTLSPSGNFLMVDIIGEGLHIINITTGGRVYLTDSLNNQLGAGLATVAWR